MVTGLPRVLLHLEGLAVAAGSVVLYANIEGPWLLFALLVLAPDLSVIGYLAGPRIGAASYDIVHFYAFPVALGVAGIVGDSAVAQQVALIWTTHIGLDRALGYGLKYPTAFGDTHLGRKAQKRSSD